MSTYYKPLFWGGGMRDKVPVLMNLTIRGGQEPRSRRQLRIKKCGKRGSMVIPGEVGDGFPAVVTRELT